MVSHNRLHEGIDTARIQRASHGESIVVCLYRLQHHALMALLLLTFSASTAAQSQGASLQPPSSQEKAAMVIKIAKATNVAVRATDANTTSTFSVNYAYDSLGRLIQETYPANDTGYLYDAAGNRIQANTQ
jgi:YD repeat-containing protein